MSLTVKLESAERQFSQILEEYFITVFAEKSLLSHGIEHHRRVWKYARELLFVLEKHNQPLDLINLDELIIACYLHDIGMSVDHGTRHGKTGRELCRRFLEERNMDARDFEQALDTIENHDNKEYAGKTGAIGLLSLLSAADDLDAFGITGIYRYVEIYLARGIDPALLGKLVPANAGKRFDHFASLFGFSEVTVTRHRQRYDTLFGFFREYNRQADSYTFGTGNPVGYCGIAELFLPVVRGETDLKHLLIEASGFAHDVVVQGFFNSLSAELKE